MRGRRRRGRGRLAGDADLFAITDRPIMEAFGLYREMALDTVQEVTSEFGPDEDLSGPGRWS
jgi:hypothetical protein